MLVEELDKSLSNAAGGSQYGNWNFMSHSQPLKDR